MKNLIKIFTIGFFLTILINCNNNDDEPSFAKIDAVTGIEMTDYNGQTLGTWGVPNEKAGGLNVFPIPAESYFQVFSQVPIKNIWIIPGKCETEGWNEDITNISASLDYEISEIEDLQVMNIANPEISNNILSVNISDLDDGIYRVFFETEDNEIYWKNTFKIEEASSIITESTDFLNQECQ